MSNLGLLCMALLLSYYSYIVDFSSLFRIYIVPYLVRSLPHSPSRLSITGLRNSSATTGSSCSPSSTTRTLPYLITAALNGLLLAGRLLQLIGLCWVALGDSFCIMYVHPSPCFFMCGNKVSLSLICSSNRYRTITLRIISSQISRSVR